MRENLVRIAAGGALIKNEMAYVRVGDERLAAEVLRVCGGHADLQVFEDTHGIRVGDRVELVGELLSVTLGPGLLGCLYDGLQYPLHGLAARHGTFLVHGASADPIDPARHWSFQPCIDPGAMVHAGDALGAVDEGRLRHVLVAPLGERAPLRVESIRHGPMSVTETVAVLVRGDGTRVPVRLACRWPMRRPFPEVALRVRACERVYPTEPLATSIRLIDTLFPIALGGTACIPGPFGAGKTVLQGLLARHSAVDVVIVIACGERAGEVVETIDMLPRLRDPRTGEPLMQRTVVVCNTSSMPVAAREASIYTGLTIGEYYRHMGHSVLVLADSTSRWAQALREISGRMEEIPGEEAFPAYLDSAVKGVYERAEVIRCRDGRQGSMTLIGTVSPAGGNLDEPVTQATLGIVKTFLGLSAGRAYRRAYPAIDPLLSWSRYAGQLRAWFDAHLGEGWSADVETLRDRLVAADRIAQMIEVTGEEGVSLEDFVLWQQAQFFDLAYLQQDAFDAVDAATPLDRQRDTFRLLVRMLREAPAFADRDAARVHYTRLGHAFRNLNYAATATPAHAAATAEVEALAGVSDAGAT